MAAQITLQSHTSVAYAGRRRNRRPIKQRGSNATGKPISRSYRKRLEARVGIEPTHKGFADLSLTTWVPRPAHTLAFRPEKVHRRIAGWGQKTGAGDGGRTRDIDLGKVALYH